jgi:DNA-binding NarL/FixJ family response regulator
VLELLCFGLAISAIAGELLAPPAVVEAHIESLKGKLGAGTRLELTRVAGGLDVID